MRTTLLLAAFAALFCGAAATGAYNPAAGCFPGDTIPKYKIKGFTFEDIVKGQFVKHAYVQAKSRMRTQAERNTPALHTECDFDGVMPIHGCYASVRPGSLKGPQVAGQYGFVAHIQYICPAPGGFAEVKVPCKIRLNTLRDNRLLSPSFWKATPAGRAMDLVCGAPIGVVPV